MNTIGNGARHRKADARGVDQDRSQTYRAQMRWLLDRVVAADRYKAERTYRMLSFHL